MKIEIDQSTKYAAPLDLLVSLVLDSGVAVPTAQFVGRLDFLIS